MALSVGDLLGDKYKILEHLGQGSWSDVYLAEDRLLARKVAIKHLRPDSLHKQVKAERFLAEARIIARIRDENVVAIYEAIEGGEKNYYLVMEYADQGTVADRLQKDGKLPVLEALELGLTAAQALEVIHAEGVLHGDIKPSNILLVHTRDGVKAKLADFGLSRVMVETGADQATYSGSILYASPEQLQEKAVDGRTDLYALGAVLYETLTGQPPFPDTGKPEDVARIIQGHLQEPPVPPSQLEPGVSSTVDELILKALSKSPDRRYPDARSMAQALREAIAAHQAWQGRVRIAYAQGLEYEQREEWEQAIACYKATLTEQPGHTEAQARLAQAREQQELAELYHQGCQAYEQGAWTEAEKTLSRVVIHDERYAGGDANDRLEETRRQLDLAKQYQEAKSCEADERWSLAISLYHRILKQELNYRDVLERLAHALDQQEYQMLYNKAREHLAAEAWVAAVETLQELEGMRPGYQDSATLLTQARRQKDLHELYARATQAFDANEWASAIQIFRQVLQLDPEYKEAAVKRALAETNQLANLYEHAKAQMEAREWSAATETLRTIKGLTPSYRDVEHLLEKARQEKDLAELYQEGVQLYEQGQWEQAIQRLDQVRQSQSGYREVERLLEQARQKKDLADLYQEGLQLYEQGQWEQAIQHLEKVLWLQPGHRDVEQRLAKARSAQEMRRERNVASAGALLIIAALSCVLFLPLLHASEALFASPTPTTTTMTPSPTLTPTLSPTPTPTPTSTPTPTPTDTPSSTPTPTPTPTITATFTPSPTILPCAYVELVEICEYGDCKRYPYWCVDSHPRFDLVLRNSGTCPWPAETKLVLVSENPLAWPERWEVGAVDVDDLTEVEIELRAPSTPRTFTITWQLEGPAGQPIGSEITRTLKVYSCPTPTPTRTSTPTPTYTPTDTPPPEPTHTPPSPSPTDTPLTPPPTRITPPPTRITPPPSATNTPPPSATNES